MLNIFLCIYLTSAYTFFWWNICSWHTLDRNHLTPCVFFAVLIHLCFNFLNLNRVIHRKNVNFWRSSNLVFFLFYLSWIMLFIVYLRTSLHQTRGHKEDFSPMFSSRRFIVQCFTSISINHVELIYYVEWRNLWYYWYFKKCIGIISLRN